MKVEQIQDFIDQTTTTSPTLVALDKALNIGKPKSTRIDMSKYIKQEPEVSQEELLKRFSI